jgi:zinc transport system ATP-binding protein
MSDVLVSIRGLHVSLGSNHILKGVNADVRRNSITALIGLNGSGKSTLLRALVKEVPYTGSVTFHCGHDHTRPSPEHVGYVPQKLRMDANLPLTVRDLFAIALQRGPLFLGVRRSVVERATRLLAEVGALHLLDSLVEKLSGGELQRVLLALALEPRPELLLLDEPAAGIDFKDVEPFNNLIADLSQRMGATVLLVSHEVNVVSRMASHVLCMRDGRIECEGPPQEIDHMLERTYGPGQAFYPHAHQH